MPFLGGRASASRGFFGGGSTPTAPTNLSSIEGNQQLTISFTAPSFNGGLTIGNYEYALSTNGGSSYGAWTALSPVDTSSPITIGGLTNGQQYSVKLRAVNALGGGQQSDPLSTNTKPFTTPSAPSISVARQASQTLRITLVSAAQGNGRDVTSYEYRIKSSGSYGSYIALSGTTGPWDIGSLTNGTTYTVQVRGVNQGGGGDGSNEPSAKPFTVPSKVSTPTSSSGDKSFSITWVAPSDGGSTITGYKVQRSTNGGASWESAIDVGNVLTYAFPSTANGTSYVGRVLAYNAAGDGEYSDASTARTPTFAAPAFSANGSYASTADPYTRRITWSVDPTDIVGSTSSSGTTTYVYLQWMYSDSTWTTANAAEELVATYQGNAATGGYGTFFANSSGVVAGEQYRIRAEQTDGVHTVGTGWINIQVIAVQSETRYRWGYTNGVQVYQTGTFNVNGGSFYQVSASSIPGSNSNPETAADPWNYIGTTQYTLTVFNISATGRSSSSASSATRYFRVQHSGTSTTLTSTTASQTSTDSNTWPGWSGGPVSNDYQWNITNIGYGNAGAGRVAVDGLGASSWSPIIDVTIEARGNKRVWESYAYNY